MKPQAITHLALRYTLCVGSALLALSTMSAAQTLSAEQAGSMSGARPSGQVEDQDDSSSERAENARKQAAQSSSEQGSSSSGSERAQNARKQAAQRSSEQGSSNSSSERSQNARKQAAQRSSEQGSSSSGSERAQNARKQAAQRSSEQGSSSSSSERAQNARKQAAQQQDAEPLPLLDLLMTHGQVALPDVVQGYQLQVTGEPGARYHVQVVHRGQEDPMILAQGIVGRDGKATLTVRTPSREQASSHTPAQVQSLSTGPVRVKLSIR